MPKKIYKPLTKEQLEIIAENSGKLLVKDLAEKLGINYSTFSGTMKQFRIPYKSPDVIRQSASCVKRRDSNSAPLVKMYQTNDDGTLVMEINENGVLGPVPLLREEHFEQCFPIGRNL